MTNDSMLMNPVFRRSILWTMVASLSLGCVLGSALFLTNVNSNAAWRMVEVLIALALHSAATLVFLRAPRRAEASWAAVIGLGVVGVNLLIVLGIIVQSGRGRHREEGWMQTIVLTGVFLQLTPVAILWQKRIHRIPAAFSGLVTLSAGALALADVWNVSFIPRTVNLTGCTIIGSIALCCVSTVLTLRVPVPRWVLWMRTLAIAFMCLAATLVIYGIWDDLMWSSDIFERSAVTACVVAVSSILVYIILTMLLRQDRVTAEVKSAVTLELRCPRCREDLVLPAGESACPHCRTQFCIRVLPQACLRCNYDMSNLRTPTCPECGAVY